MNISSVRPMWRYLPLVLAIAVGGALLSSEKVDAQPVNLAPERSVVWLSLIHI